MFKLYLICMILLPLPSLALTGSKENLLAIGQGISSPTSTSTLNFSNGFTPENPSGALYQTHFRLSGQYDSGNNLTGSGAEIGIGDGRYGLALGHYKRDCNTCDGVTRGALAGSLNGLAVGLHFEKELYSLGLLMNPQGLHRFGLIASLNDPSGENNNITAFGLGYSYVNSQMSLTLDASKKTYENNTINDDLILLTPGLSLRFNMISLSVSYDTYVNDTANSTNKNDLWWGLGMGTENTWHLAIYGDYTNQWSFSGSLFF